MVVISSNTSFTFAILYNNILFKIQREGLHETSSVAKEKQILKNLKKLLRLEKILVMG